jgi:predicted transcriptional regulator
MKDFLLSMLANGFIWAAVLLKREGKSLIRPTEWHFWVQCLLIAAGVIIFKNFTK